MFWLVSIYASTPDKTKAADYIVAGYKPKLDGLFV